MKIMPHATRHKLKIPCAVGFSLVEMLVVIAITTVVVGALGSAIVFFYRSNAYTVEQSSAVNAARKGVEFMVRDIREASYGVDGSFPVIAMGPHEFSFYADTDDDSRAERVRWRVGGTLLEKGVVLPSGDPPVYVLLGETFSRVADDVRNIAAGSPTFRYYADSGAEITVFSDVTDVAYVAVSVIVNVNPNRAPGDVAVRSSATLRNLKTNL